MFTVGDNVIYKGEPCTIASRYTIANEHYTEFEYDIQFNDGSKMYNIPEEKLKFYIENGNNIIKISNSSFHIGCKFKKGDTVKIPKNGIIGTVDKFYNINESNSIYTFTVNYLSIIVDGLPGVAFLVKEDEVRLI